MRRRAGLAVAAWGATLASTVGAVAVTAAASEGGAAAIDAAATALIFPLPFATVGLVLALRRPANPIGWLYLSAGFCWSVLGPWDSWVALEAARGGPVPAGVVVVGLVGNVIWVPAIGFGITLPALLLPDGRVHRPGWRWAVRAALAGMALLVVSGNLYGGPLNQLPFPNPLALDGVGGQVAAVLLYVGDALHYGAVVAALVSVVVRFRASTGTERQQLRWAAFGAALGILALLAAMVLPVWAEGIMIPIAALSPPVAVAVAVLRYRLWELDRLVSRTVTYLLLTGLLLVPYLLLVPLVTRMAGGAGDLAVAGATLAAAALFQPLRRRVQDLVDRRFNRRRYDAARTVAAFSARLRQEIDLDALSGELLDVIDQAVQPDRASIWLRAPEGARA